MDAELISTEAPKVAARQGGPRKNVAETPGKLNAEELVLKYLSLVGGVVARIKSRIPSYIDAGDLHSIGVIGLMDAVQRFNPEHESTFARFATVRIRGAILDELRRTDNSTRRTRARQRELVAAITEVEQKLGRTATPFDMCDQLGLSPENYQRWVEQANPVRLVSLDVSHDNGERSGSSLHDMLVDTDDVTGRDRLEKSELVEQLAAYVAELPEIPRKIMAMYYAENMTFAAIARSVDLTEARICQIHRSTLQRLQRRIKMARET